MRPPYTVEFRNSGDFKNSDPNPSLTVHSLAIAFEDITSGIDRVAIINSPDRRFIDDISSVVVPSKPIKEEIVKSQIEMYSTRKPNARLSYNGEKGVICEEGSCRFHFEDGCVNPDVLINDDCADDSYCLSYEEGTWDTK